MKYRELYFLMGYKAKTNLSIQKRYGLLKGYGLLKEYGLQKAYELHPTSNCWRLFIENFLKKVKRIFFRKKN